MGGAQAVALLNLWTKGKASRRAHNGIGCE